MRTYVLLAILLLTGMAHTQNEKIAPYNQIDSIRKLVKYIVVEKGKFTFEPTSFSIGLKLVKEKNKEAIDEKKWQYIKEIMLQIQKDLQEKNFSQIPALLDQLEKQKDASIKGIFSFALGIGEDKVIVDSQLNENEIALGYTLTKTEENSHVWNDLMQSMGAIIKSDAIWDNTLPPDTVYKNIKSLVLKLIEQLP